jgi:hypothetical protein
MERKEVKPMEILTVKEIAEKIKASPAFVYKHYKALGGVKIAGIIRFNKQLFENSIGGPNGQRTEEKIG